MADVPAPVVRVEIDAAAQVHCAGTAMNTLCQTRGNTLLGAEGHRMHEASKRIDRPANRGIEADLVVLVQLWDLLEAGAVESDVDDAGAHHLYGRRWDQMHDPPHVEGIQQRGSPCPERLRVRPLHVRCLRLLDLQPRRVVDRIHSLEGPRLCHLLLPAPRASRGRPQRSPRDGEEGLRLRKLCPRGLAMVAREHCRHRQGTPQGAARGGASASCPPEGCARRRHGCRQGRGPEGHDSGRLKQA
mmetsp:Transcript_104575/g.312347  ORF Transcript_104575/g.312347 Transcript_104575/m.312347 type:complete len:244 (+) Transcript_104575:498-1229(+)